jgi:hypothetical protein
MKGAAGVFPAAPLAFLPIKKGVAVITKQSKSPTKHPSLTDTNPRVFRGGSWVNPTATNMRAVYRLDCWPSLFRDRIGFRTAQSGCRMPLKGRVGQ